MFRDGAVVSLAGVITAGVLIAAGLVSTSVWLTALGFLLLPVAFVLGLRARGTPDKASATEANAPRRLHSSASRWGAVVLAVSVDVQGRAAVAPFIAERKLTFPVFLDPRSRPQAAYGVGALPTSILVDRHGRVVSRETGAVDWGSSAAHSVVERLLAEPVGAGGA